MGENLCFCALGKVEIAAKIETQMRISFIIYDMQEGGAERVLSILANCWAEQGEQVTLFTLDDGTVPPFYKLHSSIEYRPLDLLPKSNQFPNRIFQTIFRMLISRKAIKLSQPDVVVSFMDITNIRTLISMIGLPIPVIVSERTSPSYLSQQRSRLWNGLRRLVYMRAAKVVSVSHGIDSYFDYFPEKKRAVIHNPVFLKEPNGTESRVAPENKNNGSKRIITLGRLEKEKGHDFLIKAFAKIADKYPEWSLIIWGEGRWRADLEELSQGLEVSGRVQLPGITRYPLAELQKADLFVLSSRHEGFPNVLLEAMACGLPVISFDCATGPNEIIRDGVDGMLVSPENIEALAEAMDQLMGDEGKRNALSEKGLEVLDRFSLPKIMAIWNQLIQELTVKK